MRWAQSSTLKLALAGWLVAAAGCSNTDVGQGAALSDPSQPQTQAAQDRIDAGSLSETDIGNIAKNRKKLSCIELNTGSVQAHSLEQVIAPPPAPDNPSVQTAKKNDKPQAPNSELIDAELACHCDRGLPARGYELYERRENLMQSSKYPGIRAEISAHYPREKGEPRFLRFGEMLSDDALKKLPVVAPRMPVESCNSQCKATRSVDNEKAKAEGRPEPWPNLESPKAIACVATPESAAKSNLKKTE